MAGWMSGKGVKVKRDTKAEGNGSGWKEGDKVNCLIERSELDSTDNEAVVKQHGAGAESFINIMLRVQGDKDGRFKNSCIFHKLFPDSENAVRAAGDCQYLASYAAITDESDKGYYEDLIESDEAPDNDILAGMVGIEVGVTVGVMDNNGKQSVFVRKIEPAFDFDKMAQEAANKGTGRSRGRSRGGDAEQTQTGGRPERRGRAR